MENATFVRRSFPRRTTRRLHYDNSRHTDHSHRHVDRCFCVLRRLVLIEADRLVYEHFLLSALRYCAFFSSRNHLGVFAIAIPVIGSLIVGVMARYGSERIRGYGIPGAIESILMSGSRIHPSWHC
jgi:hypothetical protein